MNQIPINKTTLRKLGIVLFNLSQWIEKDAKFAHPNSKIRDLREILRDVRQQLRDEILEAEKNDIPGEVSSDGQLGGKDDDNRDIPPSTEIQKP